MLKGPTVANLAVMGFVRANFRSVIQHFNHGAASSLGCAHCIHTLCLSMASFTFSLISVQMLTYSDYS